MLTNARVCASRAGWAALVSAALVFAACGNSEPPPSSAPAGGAGVNAYQQEILAGGVTAAEVERAVLDSVACIRDRGVDAKADFDSQRGNLTFAISYAAGADQQTADGAYSDCYDAYLVHVDRAWADATFDEDLDARFEIRLLDCLERAGFDVDRNRPQDSRQRAYEADPRRFDDCFDDATSVYDE